MLIPDTDILYSIYYSLHYLCTLTHYLHEKSLISFRLFEKQLAKTMLFHGEKTIWLNAFAAKICAYL